MTNYIHTIDLEEKASAFAYRIGVISIQKDFYVCASITDKGQLLHEQTFAVPKSIESLPANKTQLQKDLIKGWEKISDTGSEL